MKIALLAPAEERVPPKQYGGVELIVSLIAEEMVRRGHEVHLFASSESETAGILHPYEFQSIRRGLDPEEQKVVRRIYSDLAVASMLNVLAHEKFDVLHNHCGWRPIIFSHIMHGPMVTTLHGPLDTPHRELTFGWVKRHPFVSISNSQRRPTRKLRFIETIYNGIDVETFRPRYTSGDYLAFLGRMSPQKGPLEAILFAKKARLPLLMAAKIDPNDEAWFNRVIKPHIDGRRIRYIGEVGHAGKVRLLRNAMALIGLIQWAEPFGLFFIEAMACGTPVIANRLGSVPEIVTERTGVVLDPDKRYNPREVIQAIQSLSRRACRAHVEKHFSATTMADGYERVYRRLARTRRR